MFLLLVFFLNSQTSITMLLRMLMHKCCQQAPSKGVSRFLKYSKNVQVISSSSLHSFASKAIVSSPKPSSIESTLFVQKRFKKKMRFEKPVESINDENESDADESDVEDEDSKVMHKTVISLRLDAVGKTCFGLPRAKFEECFYNGLVRINGERVSKKSCEIREGDEIDLILGNDLETRSQLNIKRVNILKVDDKAASSGRIRISFRKTNNLKIDNYEGDPYEGSL